MKLPPLPFLKAKSRSGSDESQPAERDFVIVGEDEPVGTPWALLGGLLGMVAFLGLIVGFIAFGGGESEIASAPSGLPVTLAEDEASRLYREGQEAGAAAEDPLAETEKSTERRPWLNGEGGDLPPVSPPPGVEVEEQPGLQQAPPAEAMAAASGSLGEAPPPEALPEAAPESPSAEELVEPPPAAEETAPPADTSLASAGLGPPTGDTDRPKPNDPPFPTPVAGGKDPIPPLLAKLNTLPPGQPLTKPDNSLLENTDRGLLPIIASDGNRSWQAYAAPHQASEKPQVALIVVDLGLSPEATEAAIQALPPKVSLAFSPYTADLNQWVQRARGNGHEVLLGLPMEGTNFPAQDPGPLGLLSLLSTPENLNRLDHIMSQAQGFVGFVGRDGSKFLGSRSHIVPILKEISRRGLLYVDHGGGPTPIAAVAPSGLPYVSIDTKIDETPFEEAIDARLGFLVKLAQQEGRAVGLASPYPVTLHRISRWAAELDRLDIALTPVSAVVSQ